MSANNGPAEIVNMNDARARHRGEDFALGEFESVGALLQAVREKERLPLSEIASRIHIKEAHLAAIEAGDVAALPARPYAVGFVKAYGEFLGLETAPLVLRFKEEADFNAPQEVDVEKFEAAETAADAEGRELSLWAVAVIVAFFIWCAWQITRPEEVTLADVAEDEIVASAATVVAPAAPEVLDLTEATPTESVEPVYPHRCTAGAEELETVVVSFTITAAGAVAGERVVQSSDPCFDSAALNAIKRWRFEPREVEGAARASFDQKHQFSFKRPL